jgi:hypothetical protein
MRLIYIEHRPTHSRRLAVPQDGDCGASEVDIKERLKVYQMIITHHLHRQLHCTFSPTDTRTFLFLVAATFTSYPANHHHHQIEASIISP